jgi:TolB-like protein
VTRFARLAAILVATFLAALTGTLSQTAAVAQEKELVAVLDLGILGGTEAQAAALTNQLRAEMLRTGKVTLVDRSQLDAILEEQALQQTGCTSTECAVQVGQILGIRQIVAGTLTRISDNLWQVSVQLIDVETSETVRAEVFTHEGDYRSLLLQGMARVAQALVGPAILPKVEVAEGKPGWALRNGIWIVGAGLGFGIAAQLTADAAHDDANNSRNDVNIEQFRRAEDLMETAKIFALAANALFVVGGGLILYYLISGGDTETVAAAYGAPEIAARPLALSLSGHTVWATWTVRW